MTLQEGDEVIRPAPVPDKPEMAVALSENGRMLLFPADELKELARGRGITLMGLDDGEKLVAVGFADAEFGHRRRHLALGQGEDRDDRRRGPRRSTSCTARARAACCPGSSRRPASCGKPD